MVSNFKKFLIKSLPFAAALFTCVVLLSSAAAYASEGESPSPSEVSNWLAPDLDSVAAKELAESLVTDVNSDGTRAVEYTTTDIYNLLYSALQGSNYMSVYSLPKIANYTDRIAQILYGSGQSVPTQSLYANLREIHEILNGTTNGVYVRPSIQECLFRTDDDLNFVGVSSDLGNILEMTQLSYAVLNQLHADGQNMSYYLSQINSNLSRSYNWLPISSTYLGNFTSIGGSSANYGNFNQLVVGFTPSGIYSSTPSVYRIKLPIWATPSYPSYPDSLGIDFFATNPFGDYIYFANSNFDYFFEPTVNGTYLYLFDFRFVYDGSPYYIQLSSSTPFSTDAYYGVSVSSIPFDTDDYQQLKQAFYQYKTSNSFSGIQSDVNRLANYLANPDKLAAENASQAVIDDTLDGFTGNGSAAAKTSDTGAMKNMSGSIQSGLDSGASASNATSVFSNQTFWSWFTQSTSDGINTAYPAPVVQQSRGSGDEIPDFLSGNQAELNDLLNQRNSW